MSELAWVSYYTTSLHNGHFFSCPQGGRFWQPPNWQIAQCNWPLINIIMIIQLHLNLLFDLLFYYTTTTTTTAAAAAAAPAAAATTTTTKC